MKTVSKSVLKANMFETFRYVEQTGEELIVTNNNVPTLTVVPIKQKKKVEEVFSDLRGKVRIINAMFWEHVDAARATGRPSLEKSSSDQFKGVRLLVGSDLLREE